MASAARLPSPSAILLWGYLAFVAVVLLWPTPVDRPIDGSLFTILRLLHHVGFKGVGYASVEFWANVAFFVPLGAAAQRVWQAKPRVSVWMACTLVSACGELAQGLFLPDRTSSLQDVVANAAGAALGVLLIRDVRRSPSRSHRIRPRTTTTPTQPRG